MIRLMAVEDNALWEIKSIHTEMLHGQIKQITYVPF